jgi:hypothetical protein
MCLISTIGFLENISAAIQARERAGGFFGENAAVGIEYLQLIELPLPLRRRTRTKP